MYFHSSQSCDYFYISGSCDLNECFAATHSIFCITVCERIGIQETYHFMYIPVYMDYLCNVCENIFIQDAYHTYQ